MASHIGSTPQFEAPTLAVLSKQLYDRPLWQIQERAPLKVDPETYQRAFAEMREVQERQGRCVVAADWVDRPNFLLRGIPVVME
jgi:hypothetical protein